MLAALLLLPLLDLDFPGKFSLCESAGRVVRASPLRDQEKARLLVICIRKGMTQEAVERILGGHLKGGFGSGAGFFVSMWAADFNILIHFDGNTVLEASFESD